MHICICICMLIKCFNISKYIFGWIHLQMCIYLKISIWLFSTWIHSFSHDSLLIVNTRAKTFHCGYIRGLLIRGSWEHTGLLFIMCLNKNISCLEMQCFRHLPQNHTHLLLHRKRLKGTQDGMWAWQKYNLVHCFLILVWSFCIFSVWLKILYWKYFMLYTRMTP